MGRYPVEGRDVDWVIEVLTTGAEKFPDSVTLVQLLASVWNYRADEHEDAGEWEEAVDAYKRGIQICERQISQDPEDLSFRSYAATGYGGLSRALSQLGRTDEARDAWKRMCQHFQELIAANPNDVFFCNNLAWYLATSPFPDLRDPSQALKHAEAAVSGDPKTGKYWNTLGVVHYRRDDLGEALEALDKSFELRLGGDPFDWYFRAMIHHRQGDEKQAKYWLRRSNRWTEENDPHNEELKRFRAEVEELFARGLISPAGAKSVPHELEKSSAPQPAER
jgi:tetratricopeptide (TPR) repeat protein